MKQGPRIGRIYHGSATVRSVNQARPAVSSEGTGRSAMALKVRNMPKVKGSCIMLMRGMNLLTPCFCSMAAIAIRAACMPA